MRYEQTPLKTSPIGSLDEIVFTRLGRVLEIEWAGYVVRWQRRYPLVWYPDRRALVVLEFPRRGARRKVHDDQIPASVRRAFKTWTGHDVAWQRAATIPDGQWYRLGRARRVDYVSRREDPSGVEYTHETKATLYRYGRTRATYLWVLRGGGLNITTRGIVG